MPNNSNHLNINLKEENELKDILKINFYRFDK